MNRLEQAQVARCVDQYTLVTRRRVVRRSPRVVLQVCSQTGVKRVRPIISPTDAGRCFGGGCLAMDSADRRHCRDKRFVADAARLSDDGAAAFCAERAGEVVRVERQVCIHDHRRARRRRL
jgi:hypothetical protein